MPPHDPLGGIRGEMVSPVLMVHMEMDSGSKEDGAEFFESFHNRQQSLLTGSGIPLGSIKLL